MATIPSFSPPLKFTGFPKFKPNYTPREILEFGVFGGAYFNATSSRKGLPGDLFKGLDENLYKRPEPEITANYFGVETYQRRRSHFIPFPISMLNPFGWFQWYCKFFYENRIQLESDYRIEQAIQDLKVLVYNIQLACDAAEVPFADLTVEDAKPWRQQMLQYGYDPTKNPFVPSIAETLTYEGIILTYNGEILTYGN